ncbi:MAG: hypothetical protein ABIB43_02300 [archaeon]
MTIEDYVCEAVIKSPFEYVMVRNNQQSYGVVVEPKGEFENYKLQVLEIGYKLFLTNRLLRVSVLNDKFKIGDVIRIAPEFKVKNPISVPRIMVPESAVTNLTDKLKEEEQKDSTSSSE